MSKVTNRVPRLITGAVLPAVIFALITSLLIALGIQLPPISSHFGTLPGFMALILTGWTLAGLQSLVFSFVMEFFVNPKLNNKFQVILTSGLLTMLIIWTLFPTDLPLALLAIGFMTGCTVGVCLRDLYRYYA